MCTCVSYLYVANESVARDEWEGMSDEEIVAYLSFCLGYCLRTPEEDSLGFDIALLVVSLLAYWEQLYNEVSRQAKGTL